MAQILEAADVPASVQQQLGERFELALRGLNANASRVAPCLVSSTPAPTEEQLDEAKLILLGAIQRWAEAGAGALQQQTAGPFSMTVDTRQRGGYKLWPSDISQLQDICKDITAGKAYSIDITPVSSAPVPWCSLNLGATYCSCGVDIAGVPIYETDGL